VRVTVEGMAMGVIIILAAILVVSAS